VILLIIRKYAGMDNPNLDESIDSHVLDLLNLIERECLTTEERCLVMEWAVMAQYFTMDVLTNVAISKLIGYLKGNADLFGYIKTVQQYMPVLEMQANIPLINTIMNNKYIRNLMAPTASDTFGMGKMMGFDPTPFQKGILAGFLRSMVGTDSAATESVAYSTLS
jgi:hypothetical protein